MASPHGTDGITEASDLTFPVADVEGELNLSQTKKFQVDPVSSQVASSVEIKERAEVAEKKKQQAEEAEKKNEMEKKEAMQTLKSTIIVSAVIIAACGAIFAITKKLREK